MRRFIDQVLHGQNPAEFHGSRPSDVNRLRRTRSLAPWAVVIAGALLGGCGLPPAIVVASQAADGVSYLTTGKSGTDHVLSAALEQDCALHRVISGVAVCQVEETAADVPVQTASLEGDSVAGDSVMTTDAREITMPALEATSEVQQAVAAGPVMGPVAGMGMGADTFFAPHPGNARPRVRKERVPKSEAPLPDAAVPDATTATPERDATIEGENTETVTDAEPVVGPQAAALAPVATPDHIAAAIPSATGDAARETVRPVEAPRFYVVLGSFAKRANAERAAGDISDGAQITTATVLGRVYYRVVSGPFDGASLHAARDEYARAGFAGAWPAPACANAGAGDCVEID